MIKTLPKSLIDTAKKIILESLEHPMIDIDGELKHRHNSNGTPIHHTDEGIRNFHQWFGSSKAVDEHGRPQVFYHGTDKSFNTFDPSKHGDKDHGWYGHYFTPDRDTASAYSVYDEKHPHGANVMPVYLKVHKPFKWSQEMEPLKTKEDSAESTKSLKAMGHDGVFVQNKYCNPEHEKFYETVVFHPNQIKSALGNTGEFKHSENINENVDDYKFVSDEELKDQAKSKPLKQFIDDNTPTAEHNPKVYHFKIDPHGLDPSEYDDWGEMNSNQKSKNKIQDFSEKIKNGAKFPPVIVSGRVNDEKYRPMVIDGHHTTSAHIQTNTPIRGVYDIPTLKNMWNSYNNNKQE